MANNSIKLEIDKKTFDHVKSQLDALNTGGVQSAYRALMKVLFKIQTEAKLRLTGRGHVKFSRLKNSIFVKTNPQITNKDNQLTYSDNKGKTYSSDLTTVQLKEFEGAVGTNVEYAPAIELGAARHPINSPVLIDGVGWRYIKDHPGYKGDSFLYWALKNVNVQQSVAKDMQDDLKFGKFLGKFGATPKTGKALTNTD